MGSYRDHQRIHTLPLHPTPKDPYIVRGSGLQVQAGYGDASRTVDPPDVYIRQPPRPPCQAPFRSCWAPASRGREEHAKLTDCRQLLRCSSSWIAKQLDRFAYKIATKEKAIMMKLCVGDCSSRAQDPAHMGALQDKPSIESPIMTPSSLLNSHTSSAFQGPTAFRL